MWIALLPTACTRAPTPASTLTPTSTPTPTSALTPTPTPTAATPTPTESPPPSPPPPDMFPVPAGTFTMGADTGGEGDERPAHKVTLPAFLLDKTEVTNAAYAECVDATQCRPRASRDFPRPKQPATFVGWEDARAYCAWRGKRLPREAEFERAIRGDDARNYPWGNEPPNAERAVFARPMPNDVGSKPAGRGPFGHDDLAGNVWEWMDDFYDPFAYARATASEGRVGTCDEILAAQDKLRKEQKQGFTGTNPIPVECERSIRGGAYNYGGAGLRATNRVHHAANFRIPVLGFRCAKDAR